MILQTMIWDPKGLFILRRKLRYVAALHPTAQKLRCYCIAVSHES